MKIIPQRTIRYLIIAIISIVALYYSRLFIESYNELNHRIYNDFEEFEASLESLNENISQLLVLTNYTYDKGFNFINQDTVVDFYRSLHDAEDIKIGDFQDDYSHMYLHINDVIKKILDDDIIDSYERKYLSKLYSYNNKLIEEYRNILGNLYHDNIISYNYDKILRLHRNIVKILNNYSTKADNTLNSKKYSLLLDYKDILKRSNSRNIESQISFKEAQKYCKKIFSKLVPNRNLKYSNKDVMNADKYIFKTYPDTEPPVVTDVYTPAYNVIFNKNTNELNITVRRSLVTNITHSENILDEIVNTTVKKLNSNVTNYDKIIYYDENKKIERIKYFYIEKIDGIYDEMKKLKVVIQPDGLIRNIYIIFPSSKSIIVPSISKKEILSKIDKKAQIEDIITINTIEREVEYEVHIRYKDTVYAAVFDGKDGKLKYYGRSIRDYNRQIENMKYFIN